MFNIVITLLATSVLAQKKVYEVTNTREPFGGLYVETEKPYKFQKLGGPDAEGYHYFLYKESKSSGQWFLGDGQTRDKITKTFFAWAPQSAPPNNGWKNMMYKPQRFNVISRSGVVSTLNDIETHGGSLTSDGGIVCLKQNSNDWILLTHSDPMLCDQNQDCENGLDENTQCQQETTTTSAKNTIITTTLTEFTNTDVEEPNNSDVENKNEDEGRISPNQNPISSGMLSCVHCIAI